MARIFTWTGRAGDSGGLSHLMRQFDGYYSNVAVANVPMMGGTCLHISLYGGVKIALPTSSEIYISMLVSPTSITYGQKLLEFCLSTTVLATVNRKVVYPDFPSFRGYRGNGTTDVGGGGVFVDSSLYGPYFVEVYYKPHVSSGRLVIKVNGVTDCDYTGQTVPASQSTLDTIWVGCGAGAYYTVWHINDIVVDDANWPEVTTMAVIAPNAVGNKNQWIKSATSGENYECVDDKIIVSTDYNATNEAAKIDSFGAEPLPSEAAAVKSVNVHAFAVKEGSPTPTTVKPLIRTGSTDYPASTGKAPGIAMKDIPGIWGQNPYTASPWEVSEVNAMEIGYKSDT